jgi:hypothetical protein
MLSKCFSKMVSREECCFFIASVFFSFLSSLSRPHLKTFVEVALHAFSAYFGEVPVEVQHSPIANVVACPWIHRKAIFHQLQLNVFFIKHSKPTVTEENEISWHCCFF